MAGYDYARGMSNNAVQAYRNNIKPLSKITTEDLKKSGLKISKVFASWLAKNNHWTPSEWHHSGGSWYNEVDFYDPEYLFELIDDGLIDVIALKAKYDQEKKGKQEEVRVIGEFVIWGGTRKQPKNLGVEKFTGVKKGNWIHLDSGGKKKADGNHIEWSYLE